MEGKESIIESLVEKAEGYAKTNLDLFRLKTIDKTSDVLSAIVAKLAVFLLIMLVVLLLNIALSLWIGELVGKTYFGFLIVAGFYILVALIFNYNKGTLIKTPANDFFILQFLKNKNDEKTKPQ